MVNIPNFKNFINHKHVVCIAGFVLVSTPFVETYSHSHTKNKKSNSYSEKYTQVAKSLQTLTLDPIPNNSLVSIKSLKTNSSKLTNHQMDLTSSMSLTTTYSFSNIKSTSESANNTKKNSLPVVMKEEVPVILKTKDGIERKGVLSIHPNPKGNVVLCHPASYDKNFMIEYDKNVFSEYNCLRFDFRRHGEKNKKQYSTLGKKEIHEVAAAIEILKSNEATKNLPIYGFGISLGAAALIEYESKTPIFSGLILQSTFESLRRQIQRTYAFYRIPLMHNLIFRGPLHFAAKTKFRLKLCKVNPAESIKKINTPIFLIHSKNDSYISFAAFETLLKSGKSITKTWTPENGLHTKVYKTYPEEYAKLCNEFLDELLEKYKNKKAP